MDTWSWLGRYMGRKACINGTLYQTLKTMWGKKLSAADSSGWSLNDILRKDNEVLELLIGNWKPNKTMPLSGIWKQSHFLQWEEEDQSQELHYKNSQLISFCLGCFNQNTTDWVVYKQINIYFSYAEIWEAWDQGPGVSYVWGGPLPGS